MLPELHRTLFWTPRIMGMVFAGFLSIFAFDVFEADAGFWAVTLALAMHLLPTALLLVAVILSWRWPSIGALGFFAFATWYILYFRERVDVAAVLVLAGIPFVIGLLFVLDWSRGRERSRPSTRAHQS